MAIEDYNRPAHIRAIERMAFPFGLSKTTGIMQQRCDRALSDEESVKLAVEYVSTMWDSYLRKFARSRKAVRGPHTALEFGTNWYRYDYESLRGVLRLLSLSCMGITLARACCMRTASSQT